MLAVPIPSPFTVRGVAGDLGGRIKKAGVFLNFSFDRSEGTHQAIRTLLQLNSIEVLGKLAKVPYTQCLQQVYNQDENKRDKRLEQAQTVAAASTPLPVLSAKNKPALNLQITPSKSRFQLNDILTFKANVSDNAYVHCFYRNYQGAIWQVFTNQFQPGDFLLANQPVSIPKQNKAFEIALDMANVTEQVMCVAAREKLSSRFASGKVSAEKTVSASSLDEVLNSYRQQAAGELVQQVLPIRVR